MAKDIAFQLQTVYAELLERSHAAAFDEAFPDKGTFTVKTVRGRRYWYFQSLEDGEKKQRYAGPETPELLARIERHRKRRDDLRERRALVSTLVTSARLPAPPRAVGEVLSALAHAGVFRLRGVLVGTLAFQTYGPMLGARLSKAAAQTEDIDIAQFHEISVAVEDRVSGILETLREVDPTFRRVPHIRDPLVGTAFINSTGALRVEFLAPNRGPDTDAPTPLPALDTHGQPFRYLDHLIRETVSAVVLHGAGIPVLVPAPERYAIHKLILSQRRSKSSLKRKKDALQAETLLAELSRTRPTELRTAWQEAWERGANWRGPMAEALGKFDSRSRDETLKAVGTTRLSIGLSIVFDRGRERYDHDRDVVSFGGRAGGHAVRCDVSREALEDYLGKESLDAEGCLQAYRNERKRFQDMSAIKYLEWPVEEAGRVLLMSEDVEKLRQR